MDIPPNFVGYWAQQDYHATSISTTWRDYVVGPSIDTLLGRPPFQILLRTLTDQIDGFPHRVEVRVKTWPTAEIDWDEILPIDIYPYKSPQIALENHKYVIEEWLYRLERKAPPCRAYDRREGFLERFHFLRE